MPDHLDQIAAFASKDEQVTRMRIGLQPLLYHQRKPRKAASHVGVAGREPHAHAGRNRNHHAVSSATMIRLRSAMSISETTRNLRPNANSISIMAGFAGGGDWPVAGAAILTGKNAGSVPAAGNCFRH